MSIQRTLLERFSRNRILTRRLPADFGRLPFQVSPDASLQFWKPRVESDLFDFAREFVHAGDVAWDIGANVGLFAISAAQRAGAGGRVVAVEPDNWLAGLLRGSAAMQPETSARIQVISAAASDRLGLASLHIARRGRASNFLAEVSGSTQSGGIRDTVDVVTITLDWFLEQGPPPQVLKIDVETAELKVLRGGRRVLNEAKPVILCEVSKDARPEATELLLTSGYVLYDWDARPRRRIESACLSTLAIPSHKIR